MTTFIEKFKPIIDNSSYYFEYVPIFLIFIYLSLKDEIHLNIFTVSLKFMITVFTVIFFFLLLVKFPKNKFLIFLFCSVLWIIFIFSKNKLLKL